MSVTSIAAAAQGAIPGAGARDVSPAYGLAFRFTVRIDGIKLGEWQSCTGLKVDFKPVAMKAGGSYEGAVHLPGEFTYSKVVLKRAARVEDSRAVQTWLARYASTWGASDEQDLAGDTALVVVYDSSDKPVLWWRLRDVHPAAWSGPDLNATTSKVALETLELVHNGFEVGTGTPTSAPPDRGTRTPALTLADGDGGSVEFDIPPTEIVVARRQRGSGGAGGPSSARTTATGGQPAVAGGDDTDDVRIRANQTTYKISNLILRGDQTGPKVDLLTVWSTNTSTEARGTPVLPPLTLTWGEGFSNVPVFLEAMTATYTRFSGQGKPVRAKIGLTLGVRPPEASGTAGAPHGGARNPTSGGIPGRSAHTVVDGESLPALAQEAYGDPGRWRAIATANDVDDPLRVRPGRSLLLPARTEVER